MTSIWHRGLSKSGHPERQQRSYLLQNVLICPKWVKQTQQLNLLNKNVQYIVLICETISQKTKNLLLENKLLKFIYNNISLFCKANSKNHAHHEKKQIPNFWIASSDQIIFYNGIHHFCEPIKYMVPSYSHYACRCWVCSHMIS